MQSDSPIIGITALYDTERESLWMLPAYVERVRAAGGVPVILPMTTDKAEIERLISMLDAVLLAGGQDVSPDLYGMKDETGTVEPCPARDAFETTLLQTAVSRRQPVLGICRGLQLINAVFGGTLYQDLPIQHPSPVCHRQDRPYTNPAHTVALIEGSGLGNLLKTDEIAVNSCHHQAIRTLAPSLRAAAMSRDGLIEAAERPDLPFLRAVQWHPEMLQKDDAPSRAIFEQFIRAARQYRIASRAEA